VLLQARASKQMRINVPNIAGANGAQLAVVHDLDCLQGPDTLDFPTTRYSQQAESAPVWRATPAMPRLPLLAACTAGGARCAALPGTCARTPLPPSAPHLRPRRPEGYKFTVAPVRSGSFLGTISFVAPDGQYAWHGVQVGALDGVPHVCVCVRRRRGGGGGGVPGMGRRWRAL
jgi:hypothetical protein